MMLHIHPKVKNAAASLTWPRLQRKVGVPSSGMQASPSGTLPAALGEPVHEHPWVVAPQGARILLQSSEFLEQSEQWERQVEGTLAGRFFPTEP